MQKATIIAATAAENAYMLAMIDLSISHRRIAPVSKECYEEDLRNFYQLLLSSAHCNWYFVFERD